MRKSPLWWEWAWCTNHTIFPPVLFSAAYMHLNVWHSAAYNEESENRLDAPRLLFMNISEMSDVIPVTVRHPILLDLTSKEVMGGTSEPVCPLSF